jgi:heme exporter protein A
VTDYLLRVTDLGCEREGRRLFDHLNLSLLSGECVALTGPNGSGKSTLLRCITGLYPDFEGQIDAADNSYLGHRPGVSPGLSVLENLRWYAALAGAAADEVSLIARLEAVGLTGYEDVLCARLSAGQQRRVALARLSLDSSPLWLLDEPFTALDSQGQDLVRGLINAHRAAGGAVLCATHQALGVADAQVLELRAGP